jgi:DNA-directed RNA polymerase subunit alpha
LIINETVEFLIREEKQGKKMPSYLHKYSFMNPTFVIEEDKKSAYHSVLTFKPLENGYGHTLGNALRRVLLTSIPGAAITSIRVEGVDHQFSSIEGAKEDVIEMLLNFKQVRMRADIDQDGAARLEMKGPAIVTAADIKCEAGFQVINPDQYLATLADGAELIMELKIGSGVGYQLRDQVEEKEIGEMSVDAIFSPILAISYKVESTRVGRRTDYDKLVMDLKTDGTLTPLEAVEQAAQILHKQFVQVFDPIIEEKEELVEALSPEEAEVMRLTVEELDLPTRIANALRNGGYKTVKDLTNASRSDVEKVKNIGEKSAGIVEKALNEKGVSLN